MHRGPAALTPALASAAVAVLPGAATATFPILTFPVNQPTPVTITAGASGTAMATLQVLPLSPPPPVYPIGGAAYTTSGPSETLAATFTQPDGGVTVNGYQGYVLAHVTGVGQSYGTASNDAFYLFTSPFPSPTNGHDGGYYQLTFGTSPLSAFCLACNAANFLVGPLPAYNPAHDYTVILNTRLASPGRLHFGVSDGGYNDNTGAYTIAVTQLAPRP